MISALLHSIYVEQSPDRLLALDFKGVTEHLEV